MASEWREVFLTDLYEIGSGLSKPAKDFGTGYPFLAFKDVFYNYFVPESLSQLVQSSEKERKNCSVRRGDVFLTRTSETMHELGMSCVALKDYENATFNGFTKRLRPKTGNDILPEYVGYYLRSPKFRSGMMAFSTMSTRASLNNAMIGSLKLIIPPIPEQKAIAHILKTLDDRIELNRRMNETLEALAQALFKSWFVDFDPVIDNALANGKEIPSALRAKAELRRLNAEVKNNSSLNLHNSSFHHLFPDEFTHSEELGWIPMGWRMSDVGRLGEVICGKTPPTKNKDNFGEDIPFVTIPDMHGATYVTTTARKLSIKGAETQSNKYLPENSVCVSCIATPGLVVLTSEKSQTNQQINSVIPKDPNTTFFIYECLSRLGSLIRTAGSGGSVFSNLNKGRFEKLPIMLPNKTVQEKYHKIVMDNFLKILNNQKNSSELANLRDTLLHKLLSGELRIPSAEKMVEEMGL